MTKKLTKPQAEALRKFAEKGPAHPKLYGIRDDVFGRLWIAGLVTTGGFLVRKITPKGLAALEAHDLAEYTKKWGK